MDGDHTGPFRKAFHELLRLVCFDVLLSGYISPAAANEADRSPEKLRALVQTLQQQAQASKPLVKMIEEFSTA